MAFDFPASPTVGQTYSPAGSGITYKWDGTVWNVDSSANVAAFLSDIKKVIYDTPGTIAYVPPAGLKFLEVELWGGGGGSGGFNTTGASSMSASGGGGGGGYCKKLFKASDLAATQNLVIGAGGAAGTPSVNGGAGGNTTFKGMTAGGGGGGDSSNGTRTTFGIYQRGAPGAASGGDFNGGGSSGHPGMVFIHGTSNYAMPGYGGAGFGFQQFIPYPVVSTSTPGTARPSCGCNGGCNGISQAFSNGGVGGDGFAIFTEIY